MDPALDGKVRGRPRRERRRLTSTTIYITDNQDQTLRALSDATGVPASEYIRRGIDMILAANPGAHET